MTGLIVHDIWNNHLLQEAVNRDVYEQLLTIHNEADLTEAVRRAALGVQKEMGRGRARYTVKKPDRSVLDTLMHENVL